METTNLYLLLGLLFVASTDAADCEIGWAAYKDEYCIKIFNNYLTHDEARDVCSSQGNAMSKASLLMIKDAEMQAFLTDFTQETYDTLWLGGRYDNDTFEYKWDDGDALKYTNWQDGYPRNISDPESCIEFRPANSKLLNSSDGNWANVVCQKHNLAICQKTLSWTLGDAVNEIIRIRKQLQDENDDLRKQLADTREDLETVSSRVVPVGSIYIEYFNQPSPAALWPELTWEDVTSSYAGLFFRAAGGGSDAWGSTQGQCAPRITQVQYGERHDHGGMIDINYNGWSEFVASSAIYESGPYRSSELRFNAMNCEVRPTNQAIRIWRRNS